MPNLQLMPSAAVPKGRKPLQFPAELVEGLTGGTVAATFSQRQINRTTVSFNYSENKQAQCDADAVSALSSLATQMDKISNILQNIRPC